MKIKSPKRLVRDEITGRYEEDVDLLLDSIGDFQENSISAFSMISNPSFKEDSYSHGIEKRIRSPLQPGEKCYGLTSIYSIGTEMSNGRPTTKTYKLMVSDVYWRSIGNNDDGSEILGITVQYTADDPVDSTTTGKVRFVFFGG